ncbi:uncharacterized protein LOC131050995 [Cryptomeria japonica]|uniref:uncharacterized protein LOC131050995 n=1 Tax=Cryptomeria japonica TaxID=3369 RepID=UPI0027DA2BC5|nr:uncharacterized protein LOC131050995 [Cryptomeria japonica]
MVEGPVRFIKSRVSQGLIRGCDWVAGIPKLSHLQFVDDTTLIGLACIQKAESIINLLDVYLATSGQQVIEHKSSIFFFNTLALIQRRIANILRFQIGSLPFIYLGIPLAVSRQLRPFWQDLLDTLCRTVNHWTHPWLSTASRVTLLQSVFQALPIYRGFVQTAPRYFLMEFNALSRQFLCIGNLHSSK